MKTQTKISIAVLAFAPLAVSCDKEPALPNVVLIVADDIGYGDIEWLTSLETVKTPNVKKLADKHRNVGLGCRSQMGKSQESRR